MKYANIHEISDVMGWIIEFGMNWHETRMGWLVGIGMYIGFMLVVET